MKNCFRVTITIITIAVFSCALAQEVTGTVTAFVDGAEEPRVWYTLGYETDEGYDATANWSLIMESLAAISVQAHPEQRYSRENAMSFEWSSFGGFPTDCPCTFEEVSFTYWTLPTFMDEYFATEEGTVVIETVGEVEENVYRIEGTFEATMLFQESVMSPPDPERTMTLQGTFAIERLPQYQEE